MKIKLPGFKTVVPTTKDHGNNLPTSNTILSTKVGDMFDRVIEDDYQRTSIINMYFEENNGGYFNDVYAFLKSDASFSLLQYLASDVTSNYIILDGYNTMWSENFKDFECNDLLFSVANFSSIPFGMDFTIYRKNGDVFEWAGMADFYNDHDVTRLQDTVSVDPLVHYCGFLPYRIELTHNDDFWFEIEIKHCDFKDSNLVFADKFKPISEHVTECFHVREALIKNDENLRTRAKQEFKTL